MTDSQSTEPYTPNAENHRSPNAATGDEGDSSQKPLIVTPPPHEKPFGVVDFTPPKVSLRDTVEDTSSSTSATSPGFLQVSDFGGESYEEETETDDESYTFSSDDIDANDDNDDIDGHGCDTIVSTQVSVESVSYLWQCPYCGRRASQNCCLTCMMEDAVFPEDYLNAQVDSAGQPNSNNDESDNSNNDESDREP